MSPQIGQLKQMEFQYPLSRKRYTSKHSIVAPEIQIGLFYIYPYLPIRAQHTHIHKPGTRPMLIIRRTVQRPHQCAYVHRNNKNCLNIIPVDKIVILSPFVGPLLLFLLFFSKYIFCSFRAVVFIAEDKFPNTFVSVSISFDS